MADGVSMRRLKQEPEARAALPYARHVTDEIVALDSGALMIGLKLDGVSFETADARDLNDWHVKLNQAWRNLADDRLAVWHHVVRRPIALRPATGHASAFARELSVDYDARLAAGRLFVNELYVSLVLHPGREAGERAGALMRRLRAARRGGAEIDAALLRRLEDAARDLVQFLGRYGPRCLGLYERRGLWFSEP
ncbi:MAG: transporter, partial [Brevundimonas mediterranea]